MLRAEVVNIGLVVYLRDRLDVRMVDSYFKVKVLDPEYDLSSIRELPSLLNSCVEGMLSEETWPVVDARHAVISHIGEFCLSPPGYFAPSRGKNYEACVSELLELLVAPKVARLDRVAATMIQTRLKKSFEKAGILGRDPEDIGKHLVVPNFPISPEQGIVADFAYQNGKMRITEALDFRVKDLNQKRFVAAMKAVTFDRARKVFGNDTLTTVVFAASPDQAPVVDRSLALLRDSCDELIDINSASFRKLVSELSPLPA